MLGVNEIKPGDIEMESFSKVSTVFKTAMRSYKMKYYEGEILVFYAKDHYYFGDWNKRVLYKRLNISNDTKSAWKRFAKSVKIYEIDGEHSTIFNMKYAAGLAVLLQKHLNSANIAEVQNPEKVVDNGI